VTSWDCQRREVPEPTEDALGVICAKEGVKVGTVFRKTAARRKEYSVQRHEVYEKLIQRLDNELETAGQLGIVFMDGNGSDHSYFNAHRKLKLASRNIIEDPLFQAAHRSQWIQMADLVAWAAYQSVGNLMQRWYGCRFERGVNLDINGTNCMPTPGSFSSFSRVGS